MPSSTIARVFAPEDRRIPLVVGVCGHRDLREQDTDRLLMMAGDILVKLKTAYPSTPLIVLSALAEGADRIVARAALKLQDHYPNEVRLIVPLPMPLDIYARDFVSHADSLKEFRQLLKRADHVFERRLLKGSTHENIQEPGAHRDRQYQDVGKYIARHCQILIALWDGQNTGRIGGTWEIVRFKIEGVKELGEYQSERGSATEEPPRSLLEPAECGPVYQIVTPRRGQLDVEGALTRRRLYPSMFLSRVAAADYYAKIFQNAEDFNRQAVACDDGLQGEMTHSKKELVSSAVEHQLPLRLQAILERHSLADVLALRFARRTRNVQRELHLEVFVGLALFEYFAHVPSWWPVNARVMLLSLSLLVFLRTGARYLKGQRFLDTHQDYRALAEGLRVQFFWALADVDRSVANYYLGRHRTELDWIRNALRSWNIPTTPPERVCRMELVLEHWLKHQYEYFLGCEDEKTQKKYDRGLQGLLILAAVAIVVYLLYLPLVVLSQVPRPSVAHHWAVPVITLATMLALAFTLFLFHRPVESMRSRKDPSAQHLTAFALATTICVVIVDIAYWLWRPSGAEPAERIAHVLTPVIALTLIGAGLMQHYAEKMAFREHAKQYRHMEGLFRRALEHMNRAQTTAEKQEVLRDLGISALEENGDWVMLHRERPLEVPFG